MFSGRRAVRYGLKTHPMTDRDPKYLVGRRPVNRRTAGAAAVAPKVAPVAVQRARVAQTRSRLGAPLAEQLRSPAAARAPLGKTAVGGGILGACGALGLFLAWLHASPLIAVAGAGGLAGGLLLARGRRRGPQLGAPALPLFDPEAVGAFDQSVQQLATELPAEVVQSLVAFKQLVLRMARHPGAVDEHFHVEDRLYANECLRRYLPDSLQAYLGVPREQRGAPLADGQSPQDMLLQQLALLHAEMEKREAALARGATEALLRQQRFLAAKKR